MYSTYIYNNPEVIKLAVYPRVRICMAEEISAALLWPAIFLLLLSEHCARASATPPSFFYNFSNPQTFSHGGGLHFDGDAYMGDGSVILAKDRNGGDETSKAGRASYNHPVYLWSNATSEVTAFSTSFSFVIHGCNSSNEGRGGTLSFFLAQFSMTMPVKSEGVFLGLFNSITAAGSQWIVGLEFDAHGDFDRQTNMPSTKGKYMLIQNLADGVPKILKVDYNDITKYLVVVLRDCSTNRTAALKIRVNLRRYLPRDVAMGFSAATGGSCAGLHQVLWWSFSTSTATVHGDFPTAIPARSILEARGNSSAPPPPGDNDRRSKSNRKVVVIVSVALFVVTTQIIACLCYISRWQRRRHMLEPLHYCGSPISIELDDPIYMSYEVLLNATGNFCRERLLGDRGFGSFYRGDIVISGLSVAVKRLMNSPNPSVYMPRIRVLKECKHKNLVCLLDWCRGHDDTLYLIYEFVGNGNLAEYLYNPERLLAWPMRYNIVHGMGFALEYLHLHRAMSVQHGNIKPSNVMLDESFNAKLGDFSMAPEQCYFDRASSNLAELQGYIYYMDPEVLMGTKRASVKSDVYSFGVVLLEIACGRPPVLLQQDQDASLVESVWKMYEKGTILEVADKRLNGEFDEREMERVLQVGLMCAHPYGVLRPTVDQVMRILSSDQAVPTLLPRTAIPTPVTEVDEARSAAQAFPESRSP